MERAGSPGRTSRARITRRGCHGAGRLPGRPTSVPGASRPVPFVWRGTASSSPEKAVGRLGRPQPFQKAAGLSFRGFFLPTHGCPPLGGRFKEEAAKLQHKPWPGDGPDCGHCCGWGEPSGRSPVCQEAAGGGSGRRQKPPPLPGGAPTRGPALERGRTVPGRAVPAVGAGGVRTRPVHARVA